MRRALRFRCPQCGEGRLFARYARLAERCRACGLLFRRESGAQTGAMYLSAAVSELFAAAVALALFFGTDWGTVAALGVGTALVLGFAFAFLPYAMALWTAIEYATDVGNREPWARPR